ncbi:MAG: putative bifunctional diguanylate cyclase/phosphodiesterase [Steroidobacter sp.]
MRDLRSAFTGLGTRVATRTFLTFGLCALIPIALSALISHRVVSDELRGLAAARLMQASKAYGLLVYERLRQNEELLTRLARIHLEGNLSAAELREFESERVRIIDVRTEAMNDSADPRSAFGLFILREQNGEPQVALTASLANEERRLTVTGVIASGHLWNADALEIPGAQLCVHDDAGLLLHCTDDVPDITQQGPPLVADWPLFLRPTYGVAAWSVQTRQSPQIALATLTAFRRTLPLVTMIAMAVALLLSVVQIRRSHRPLATLTDAAMRIAERRFTQPIVVDARDEFGSLALAFNQMTAGLARQFATFGALARIDRMILASPSIGRVLERTLPALPRLVCARAAAVLVYSDDRGDALLYVARRDDPQRVRQRRMAINGEELRALLNEHAGGGERLAELRDELRAVTGCTAMDAAPIRVDRELRGVLLLGRTHETARAEQRRYARAFARRFAVALGAEERRQALLRQAYYDDLTGLPNRQLFKDRLRQELAHARRAGESVALIYIDLDRFKNINDSLGHTAGDELLRQVGARFGAVVRDVDTLARLGGDEFVIIASGVRESPAHVLAERLQTALSSVAAIGDVTCFIEASMGIAVYPQDGGTAEILLRNADTAMYRAKSAGGGRAVYFEEDMNRDAIRRLDLEQRLRIALKQRSLSLAYQPKIRTSDGSIFGVEALARWTDAELGPVSPAEFIPVAEECGLIDDLGEWAMLEACETFQSWRRAGIDVGHIGVNVSLRQLRNDRFLQRVQRILDQTQTPAHALELEVTESTLAERPEQVMRLLDQLRAIGVRIAIDDFGVGYSSMAALGQLPADVLKIDRSFITGCATHVDAASIVEAIISMAHALGKLTVAEGVETVEQLELLRTLGCDVIQGYLFAKPMTSDEMIGFSDSLRNTAGRSSSEPIEEVRAIAS